MTLPSQRRDKTGHGFATGANATALEPTTRTSAKQRLLIIVPHQWPVDEARKLREYVEDLGHFVTLLRTDDMMRTSDITDSMLNKDKVFLFTSDNQRVREAREAAHELVIPLVESTHVSFSHALNHVRIHT